MEAINVHFPNYMMFLCIAIKIDESDFCAELDQDKKILATSWK